MAESMSSLFRRGAISSKQMDRMAKPAILNKTKVQPSKMADFDSKKGKRDQGGVRDRGEVPVNEINHKTNQKPGTPSKGAGLPSKGARVNRSGQPDVDHIDQQQGPKFPAGAKISAGHGKRQVGIRGHSGKSSGPQYGGPSSRANG